MVTRVFGLFPGCCYAVTSLFGWFPVCCYVRLLVCLGGFQGVAMRLLVCLGDSRVLLCGY